MKSRKLIFSIATMLYISIAVFLSVMVYKHANEFKEYKSANAKILDGEKRITDWKEWLNISDLWKSKTDASHDAIDTAELNYENAVSYSFLLIYTSIIYLILAFFLFRKTSFLFRYLSLCLITIAFILLALGISIPMLEIAAFKDGLTIPLKGTIPIIHQDFDLSKEFDGRMYFYYQNKSILDVIGLLFSNNNALVGFCILLFSIITPLLKLLFSLFLVFYPNNKNKIVGFIVNNLGKWSMADVFVVAIFLGYLSFQNMSTGIETEANTLLGLYYFLTFVIISIISSILLKESAKKSKETVIIP
jgi:hypothetical protein